jgi:hypothetical protein
MYSETTLRVIPLGRYSERLYTTMVRGEGRGGEGGGEGVNVMGPTVYYKI